MQKPAFLILIVCCFLITAVAYFFPFHIGTRDAIAGVGTLGHIAVGGETVAGRGSFTFALITPSLPRNFMLLSWTMIYGATMRIVHLTAR